MQKILTSLFLLLAVSACSTAPKPLGGSPNIQVTDANSMPPPTRADLVAATRAYLIGPYDKLSIDVFGIDELKKEVQIDASGRLSFPLIGAVEASGLSPEELGNVIEDRLRGRFIKDPQVSVNLTQTISQVITVDGQVTKPGLYPVVGNMTLMRAVATAGGVGEFAKLEDVVVFRTVNGQQMAGLYNLEGIRRGNYDDPEIFGNDVIVVGDSKARRLFRDILQASPLLTTPLVVMSRWGN